MSKSTVETIITNKINEGYGLTKLNSNQRIIIIGSRPNCNGDWMKDYGIHKNTKEQLILFANKYNIQDYNQCIVLIYYILPENYTFYQK